MVSCGMKLVKYLLFIFNFIFFVTGGILLGLGIYVIVSAHKYAAYVGPHYQSVAILLIVVGSIITIIGFFGCYGACAESHCMMITFSVLLGIIFILELAAGIAAYVMRNKLDDIIQENMNDSLKEYSNSTDEGIKRAWDILQHDFKCCGVKGSQDWENNHKDIPQSCCKEDTTHCAKGSGDLYEKGCYQKFVDFVKGNIAIIGGVGIGIAFIQIIGIIFACCLASAIKREYEIV